MEHGACEEVCSIELSDTVFHFHVSFTGDRALDPETNRQESVALCMRGILLRNFIASFFVKDDCSLKMALQSFSSVLHVPQVSAVLDVAFVYECFSSQVCFQMFPTLAEEWEKEISKTEDATLCAWLVQFFCLKQALATQELVDFAPSFFWILVSSLFVDWRTFTFIQAYRRSSGGRGKMGCSCQAQCGTAALVAYPFEEKCYRPCEL